MMMMMIAMSQTLLFVLLTVATWTEPRLASSRGRYSCDVINMKCSSSHLLCFLLVTVTAVVILTLISLRILLTRRPATQEASISTFLTHILDTLS